MRSAREAFATSQATELYAVGTRAMAMLASFGGGALAIVLFKPQRIGVFLAFISLATFAIIAELSFERWNWLLWRRLLPDSPRAKGVWHPRPK